MVGLAAVEGGQAVAVAVARVVASEAEVAAEGMVATVGQAEAARGRAGALAASMVAGAAARQAGVGAIAVVGMGTVAAVEEELAAGRVVAVVMVAERAVDWVGVAMVWCPSIAHIARMDYSRARHWREGRSYFASRENKSQGT